VPFKAAPFPATSPNDAEPAATRHVLVWDRRKTECPVNLAAGKTLTA
jgi:hypothetical protein